MSDIDAVVVPREISAPERLSGEIWFALLVLVAHIAVLAAGITWAMDGF